MLVDGSTRKIAPFYHLDNLPLGNLSLLEGAKRIELETRIHKDSINFYRYSIIENDTILLTDEVIPKKIKFEWNNESDFPGYLTMDLGTYNIANKKLEVRMYKLPKKTQVSSAIIYNKPIKPVEILFTNVYNLKKEGKGWIEKPLKNGDKIINDENTIEIKLGIKNTDLNIIYGVTLENAYGNGTNFLSPNWSSFDKDGNPVMSIDAKQFKSPGNYLINVYVKSGPYPYFKKEGKIIKFTVLKTEQAFFSTKELIGSGILFSLVVGAITGGLAVYIKNRQIKKKVAAEAKQKEIAQLQLNSVRSQLNPHFLFNALAGIQNLMNKNEIENANRYLTKFARLTRNVLDSKDLISLNEEKFLLDDYLQMEQLRFGFQYAINASHYLEIENIEIPSMLLQPFVENAVKHGIAENAGDGKIEVNFEKQGSDLILKITDNGKGFDANQTYIGLGLALSKNRIALLNTIYKITPLVLDIQSDANGTLVTITLTQWL